LRFADVTNGSTANGAKLQIWSCTPGAGDAAQHFTVTADKRIQWAAHTTECLDLTGGSLTSGNQVCISSFCSFNAPLSVSVSDRMSSFSLGPDVGLRNGQHQPSVEHCLIDKLGHFSLSYATYRADFNAFVRTLSDTCYD
jgi:hypothetical protein